MPPSDQTTLEEVALRAGREGARQVLRALDIDPDDVASMRRARQAIEYAHDMREQSEARAGDVRRGLVAILGGVVLAIVGGLGWLLQHVRVSGQ